MKKLMMFILMAVLAGGLFGQTNLLQNETTKLDSVWYSYVDIEDAMATIGIGYVGEEYGLAIAFDVPAGEKFNPTKVELGLRECCVADLTWSFIRFKDDYIIDEQLGDLTGVISFTGGETYDFIYKQADIESDVEIDGGFAVKVMIPATDNSWYPCQQNSPYGHYNYAYYNGAWGRLEEVWFPETSWCVSVGGWQGGTGVNEELLPGKAELYQNYPNPFNPETTIKFYNNMSGNVKLTVYNTKGEVVANLINGRMGAGIQSVKFDASNLNSGIYYYRLEAPTRTLTKKMVLVK